MLSAAVQIDVPVSASQVPAALDVVAKRKAHYLDKRRRVKANEDVQVCPLTWPPGSPLHRPARLHSRCLGCLPLPSLAAQHVSRARRGFNQQAVETGASRRAGRRLGAQGAAQWPERGRQLEQGSQRAPRRQRQHSGHEQLAGWALPHACFLSGWQPCQEDTAPS